MCGIAGIYDPTGRPVDEQICAQMMQILRHRGPDDRGMHLDQGAGASVGLAQTRLAIVDLTDAGRQPMASADGRFWLIVNGEIYNAPELRREMESKGYRFSSQTDVEVILPLWQEYGEDALRRLDGMFALAIWDRRDGKLVLARDRFGVKPLYFAQQSTQQGDRLLFASEAKAFLAVPGFRAELDPEALFEHFTFQWCTGGRSLFRGVEILEPGCFLEASPHGVRRGRYFRLQYDAGSMLSERDAVDQVRAVFEAAVDRQLMSDVPIGAFLSGGMDTGSIVAAAGRGLADAQDGFHTFTCGFDAEDEQASDERAVSYELAELLGTQHHALVLTPEHYRPVIPQVVYHLDEPRVGISYQVFHIAELISKHVKVVLSGVGGDELFAGYPWRYSDILEETDAERFASTYYRKWVRFYDDEQKRDLFSDSVLSELNGFSTWDSFRSVLDSADTDVPLHKALYFDFHTFLHGLFLVDDKLTMAHSIEARVPFMDNALLDLCTRIPADLKLSRDRPWKDVLKKAMKGLLPEETLHRRKQGFTPPDATWYRGPHRAYLEEMILSERALDRGVFRPEMLRRILDEHQRETQNHRFLIWSLLCIEWWNRLFVDGEHARFSKIP